MKGMHIKREIKEYEKAGILNANTLFRITFCMFNYNHVYELKDLYEDIIPDKYKYDSEYLSLLCSKNTRNLFGLLEYIEKVPGLVYKIIDENIKDVKRYINYCGSIDIPEYICEYVGVEARNLPSKNMRMRSDKIDYIGENCNSNLYNKLYTKYSDSFYEKLKDSGEDLSDKIFFMYTMINSNVLENIYKDNYYTIGDINFVSAFLNYLEEECDTSKYPTATIRNNMEIYRKKYAAEALNLYNKFAMSQKNEAVIEELAKELGINKNNIFKCIKKQKYWSGLQKEFVITLLSIHFKTGDVLTIYDIIDFLEEMEERQLTKNQILDDKGIDPKFFDKLYNKCQTDNIELYNLIQQKFNANKLRGFKKLLILYKSLMSSHIDNYDDFVNKYKRTPDEILGLFTNSEFYDDVYGKISSWYNSIGEFGNIETIKR